MGLQMKPLCKRPKNHRMMMDTLLVVFLTPDEYQPSPPRHRRRLQEEDPEYDPSAEVRLVL